MGKLRKIGLLLWQHKERMVLVVLVAILGFRVYRVVTDKTELPSLPVARASGEAEESPAAELTQAPPQDTDTENYQSLSQRNPFWYYGARPEATGTEGETEEETIYLLDIQRSPSGGYTAQIQTKNVKWYKEGEQFESYRLMKIDPANRSVEVYSEKSGTTLTLTM